LYKSCKGVDSNGIRQGIVGLFATDKPLIGVVHLPPLLGSPKNVSPFAHITERALADTRKLVENGIDAIIVENYGDVPFFPDKVEPHTVAAMTLIADRIKSEHPFLRVGVNVLRNDALSAMAIATITVADFIRVNVHCGAMLTDQGLLQGKAYKTLRYRKTLGIDVKIFADVMVKHAVPLSVMDIETSAQDTYYRGLADALIVTGVATGSTANLDEIRRVKSAVPEAAVFVGSGVTEENLKSVLCYADGVIIGTALKKDGKTINEVDTERVKRIVSQKNICLSESRLLR